MNPGKSGNKNTKSWGFLASAFPKLKKLGTGPLPKPTPIENPNYGPEPESLGSDPPIHESQKSSVIVPSEIKSFHEFMTVYDSYCGSLVKSKSFLERRMYTKAYHELDICITFMETISNCDISSFLVDKEDAQILQDLQKGVAEERIILETELKKQLSAKIGNPEPALIQDPPSYDDVLATDLLFYLKQSPTKNNLQKSLTSVSTTKILSESIVSTNTDETFLSDLDRTPEVPLPVSNENSFLHGPSPSTRSLEADNGPSTSQTYTLELNSLESHYTPVYKTRGHPYEILPSSEVRDVSTENSEDSGTSSSCLSQELMTDLPKPRPRLSKMNSLNTNTTEDSSIYQNISDMGLEFSVLRAQENQRLGAIPRENSVVPDTSHSGVDGRRSVTYGSLPNNQGNSFPKRISKLSVEAEKTTSGMGKRKNSLKMGFEDALNKLEAGVISVGVSRFYVKLQPDDYQVSQDSNEEWNLVLILKKPKIYFVAGDSVLSPARDNVYIYQGEVYRGRQVDMKMEISRSCIHRCNFQPDTVTLLSVSGYYVICTGDTVVVLKPSTKTKDMEDFEDVLKYKGTLIKEQFCQEGKSKKNEWTKSMSSLRDQAVITTRRSLRSVRKLGIVQRFSTNSSDLPPIQRKPYVAPLVLPMKDEKLVKIQKIARMIEENVHNGTVEKI